MCTTCARDATTTADTTRQQQPTAAPQLPRRCTKSWSPNCCHRGASLCTLRLRSHVCSGRCLLGSFYLPVFKGAAHKTNQPGTQEAEEIVFANAGYFGESNVCVGGTAATLHEAEWLS